MLFKEKENQIKYKKYDKSEKVKQRHFTLNTEILENINELIQVFNKKNPNLNLTSSLLANIIFDKFFIEFASFNDAEKLQYIKEELLNQLNEY